MLKKRVKHTLSVSGAAAADGWNRAKSVGWFPALEDFCFRAHVLPDTVTGAQAPLKQRQLSFAVDNHIFASLLSSSPLLHKARLLSVSAPGASAWLGVIPSPSLNQVFDSRQFTALVRWWLGLPVYARVSACPTCGVAMDLFGYHALTCRTRGSLGVRHNALREVFLHFCNTAGIRAERESPGLLPDSADRPADVLLPSQVHIPNYLPDSATCLDFAVTHPQQPTTIDRAGEETAAAATLYESKVKLPRYESECLANKLNFIPMVVEAFGAWGEKSEPVFKFVSRAAALCHSADEDKTLGYVRAAMSVVLQRHNANMLVKHRDPESPVVDGPVPDY